MPGNTLFDRLVAVAGPTWHSYIRHDFVLRLAQIGELPVGENRACAAAALAEDLAPRPEGL